MNSASLRRHKEFLQIASLAKPTLKEIFMVQTRLELKISSRSSPTFYAKKKKKFSHLKKKMGIKPDYTQLPAGPASG